MLDIKNMKIAVIGLVYVGLPLAIDFYKHLSFVDFDINHSFITTLSAGTDHM